jgi:hypothetical protein
VSISAANDGTVTLANASGNVNLISSDGNATLYGKGVTDQALTGSNITAGYDYFGSNAFPIPFDSPPVVIVSMYAINTGALPLLGTTIVATNITTTGFQVWSDEQDTPYNWTASAINV